MSSAKHKAMTSWLPSEGGYEKTNSADMILQVLRGLQKRRGFVILLQKGYQSSNTVIIEFSEERIIIDKPPDWPAHFKQIRVVFRDEAKVWNHFTVAVSVDQNNTLKTNFPTELFRLQRRSNYRIETPHGTALSFRYRGQLYTEFQVVNVSVGGLFACRKSAQLVMGKRANDEIRDLALTFPVGHFDAGGEAREGDDEADRLEIQRGRIVRELLSQGRAGLCIGVEFFPKANEEKKLLQYVRQRELEILRMGVSA